MLACNAALFLTLVAGGLLSGSPAQAQTCSSGYTCSAYGNSPGDCNNGWTCDCNNDGCLNYTGCASNTVPACFSNSNGWQDTWINGPVGGSRTLYDNQNAVVKIKGVNWNGAEGTCFVPTGLDKQNAMTIGRKLHDMGYNTVRLPFSVYAAVANPVIPTGCPYAGSTFQSALHDIITQLHKAGMFVMLDAHRLDPNGDLGAYGNDDNGQWYNPNKSYNGVWFGGYTWSNMWANLASNFSSHWNIVAADLYNEPRTCSNCGSGGTSWSVCWSGSSYHNCGWGSGGDWHYAAIEAANKINAYVGWLIVIEAPQNGDMHGWNSSIYNGGYTNPNKPWRIAFSAHDYSFWHGNPFSCSSVQNDDFNNWAFMLSAGTKYPVLLGETGTCHNNSTDGAGNLLCYQYQTAQKEGAFWSCIASYSHGNNLDSFYWLADGADPINTGYTSPENSSGYGIFNSTYDGPYSSAVLGPYGVTALW